MWQSWLLRPCCNSLGLKGVPCNIHTPGTLDKESHEAKRPESLLPSIVSPSCGTKETESNTERHGDAEGEGTDLVTIPGKAAAFHSA